MTDHSHADALAADQRQPDRTDPRAQARGVIAEATQVITSRRATLTERVAAYRRRGEAWTELADALHYDQQLTPTMRQAAADDHARARVLSSRIPSEDPSHGIDIPHLHDHRKDRDRRDGPAHHNRHVQCTGHVQCTEHDCRDRADPDSGHEH